MAQSLAVVSTGHNVVRRVYRGHVEFRFCPRLERLA